MNEILTFLFFVCFFSVFGFELQPLPWDPASLEPHISKETIDFHYGKHHRGYVTKLNALIETSPLRNETLEFIIKNEKGSIFNLAAQSWNHEFYWKSLSPSGGGEPQGALRNAIIDSFGSIDSFKAEFDKIGSAHFGSGWTWLVGNPQSRKLQVMDTHDAGNPLTGSFYPLLTCDVWEHAYYLQYKNDRSQYLKSWWHLVNWNFASENYLQFQNTLQPSKTEELLG